MVYEHSQRICKVKVLQIIYTYCHFIDKPLKTSVMSLFCMLVIQEGLLSNCGKSSQILFFEAAFFELGILNIVWTARE